MVCRGATISAYIVALSTVSCSLFVAPLILIGVIPALFISGKPFGFVAICGVLGLVGMMLKNGIVLMD